MKKLSEECWEHSENPCQKVQEVEKRWTQKSLQMLQICQRVPDEQQPLKNWKRWRQKSGKPTKANQKAKRKKKSLKREKNLKEKKDLAVRMKKLWSIQMRISTCQLLLIMIQKNMRLKQKQWISLTD